jgi:hypothetical protein
LGLEDFDHLAELAVRIEAELERLGKELQSEMLSPNRRAEIEVSMRALGSTLFSIMQRLGGRAPELWFLFLLPPDFLWPIGWPDRTPQDC